MNKIFEHLAIHNPKDIIRFAEWYKPLYSNLPFVTFSQLSFEHQLGVFLRFFEDKFHFTVIADNTGYISYFTDENYVKKDIVTRFKTESFYNIQVETNTPSITAMEQYGKAIIYLFNNLDLPF